MTINNSNEPCNYEPGSFLKEGRKEIIRWMVGMAGIIAITAVAFYFNTQNDLAAHTNELNRLQRQIDNKADQATIEKRLDRMENKIDNLIQLQMTRQNEH